MVSNLIVNSCKWITSNDIQTPKVDFLVFQRHSLFIRTNICVLLFMFWSGLYLKMLKQAAFTLLWSKTCKSQIFLFSFFFLFLSCPTWIWIILFSKCRTRVQTGFLISINAVLTLSLKSPCLEAWKMKVDFRVLLQKWRNLTCYWKNIATLLFSLCFSFFE